MSSYKLSNYQGILLIGAFSTALVFTVHLGSASGEPPVEGRRGSISVGTPMRGELKRGEVLPKKGTGYVLSATTVKRKARFGVFELVMLIKRAAFQVHRKYAGPAIVVGDLSVRTGGRIKHHGSHQNGRDVDFMFYVKRRDGKRTENADYIPFDRNGFSTNPPMEYVFDRERNWALVKEIIASPKASVQWIFVSKHLKGLLLLYAEKIGEHPRIIRKAEQMLHQPGKKAHADHFHVRIYCPRSDRSECKDVGPRWAWIN